ncbi:hypothetical protein [Acaryochloris marina]|uniref:hypothetical protein n=1 Tax=Acaryochloris marina TaxID=155978 RepID=UPI0021C31811|nr:hypothetical protein [Acaryochloris marina]
MSFTGHVEDFLRDINTFSNFSAKLSASLCLQIRLSATLFFQAVYDRKYGFNERIGFSGQQRQGYAFKKQQGYAVSVKFYPNNNFAVQLLPIKDNFCPMSVSTK